MNALNDVEIMVIPVKSPQNGHGDWAHTNSRNVMKERKKETYMANSHDLAIHTLSIFHTIN